MCVSWCVCVCVCVCVFCSVCVYRSPTRIPKVAITVVQRMSPRKCKGRYHNRSADTTSTNAEVATDTVHTPYDSPRRSTDTTHTSRRPTQKCRHLTHTTQVHAEVQTPHTHHTGQRRSADTAQRTPLVNTYGSEEGDMRIM